MKEYQKKQDEIKMKKMELIIEQKDDKIDELKQMIRNLTTRADQIINQNNNQAQQLNYVMEQNEEHKQQLRLRNNTLQQTTNRLRRTARKYARTTNRLQNTTNELTRTKTDIINHFIPDRSVKSSNNGKEYYFVIVRLNDELEFELIFQMIRGQEKYEVQQKLRKLRIQFGMAQPIVYKKTANAILFGDNFRIYLGNDVSYPNKARCRFYTSHFTDANLGEIADMIENTLNYAGNPPHFYGAH